MVSEESRRKRKTLTHETDERQPEECQGRSTRIKTSGAFTISPPIRPTDSPLRSAERTIPLNYGISNLSLSGANIERFILNQTFDGSISEPTYSSCKG
jgi:hypothetical protein